MIGEKEVIWVKEGFDRGRVRVLILVKEMTEVQEGVDSDEGVC